MYRLCSIINTYARNERRQRRDRRERLERNRIPEPRMNADLRRWAGRFEINAVDVPAKSPQKITISSKKRTCLESFVAFHENPRSLVTSAGPRSCCPFR
jgi:hypothetical protein